MGKNLNFRPSNSYFSLFLKCVWSLIVCIVGQEFAQQIEIKNLWDCPLWYRRERGGYHFYWVIGVNGKLKPSQETNTTEILGCYLITIGHNKKIWKTHQRFSLSHFISNKSSSFPKVSSYSFTERVADPCCKMVDRRSQMLYGLGSPISWWPPGFLAF